MHLTKSRRLWRVSVLMVLAGVTSGALAGCQSAARQAQKQGVGYYHAGHYHMALLSLKKASTNDPLNARAQYYTGLSYMKLHQYEQAEYHLKTAWDAFPAQPGLKTAMIHVMLKEKKINQLLNFLERDAALTARTENPRLLPALPKYKLRSQRDTEIKKLYASRIRDRLQVAQIYQKIGDMDNALVNYRVTQQLAANDPTVLMACARFYQQIHDQADLRSALYRLYEVDPSMPGLVNIMTQNHIYISQLTPPPAPRPRPANHQK